MAPRKAPPRPAAPPVTAERTARRLPDWAIPLGLALLHLVACLVALDPGAFPGGDNGTYVSLARGILERGAYVDYWDPAQRPHTLYPPVFPLILAGGLAAGLTVWVGIKLLCIAISAAAVGIGYLWLRRVLPPRPALAAGVFTALAVGTLPLAAQVLSDIPFWGWVMLALWAYARVDEEPDSWRWEALGAAAVALGFFTRSAGLPLVVAALIWLAMRRRWRGAAMLALAVGPAGLAWWLRTRSLQGTSVYASEFWLVAPYAPQLGNAGPGDLALRVLDNLRRYGTEHLPSLFFGFKGEEAAWAVGAAIVVLLLAVGGWAGRLRKPGLAELFVPLYVGLLLIWPATWGGDRFLLPLLPLLLGYAAMALRSLAERFRFPLATSFAVGVMACALFPGLRYQAAYGQYCRAEYRAGILSPCLSEEWSELLGSAVMLRGQLPAGSVVIHRKPTLFFAASGYRSRLYPKSTSPDTFFALVREIGADYVVVDRIPDMSHFLHGVFLSTPHRFCVVESLSLTNATLARIVPDAPPMPPGSPPGRFRTCPVAGRLLFDPAPP